MVIAVIALSTLEIIILQVGALILGIAIHFFFVSQKTLKQTLGSEKKLFASPSNAINRSDNKEKKSGSLQQRVQNAVSSRKIVPDTSARPYSKTKNVFREDAIESFRESILQQQRNLNDWLHPNESHPNEETIYLQNEINKLEGLLQKREDELKNINQQVAATQKMASKIEEVYKEFDLLQKKIADLEKETQQTTNLALELEDARQSYGQLEKKLLKKEEELEQLIEENKQLHDQLLEKEHRLRESNQQRQQLVVQTKLLEEMNSDLESMSVGNKKLQTELRRIGELESMLNIIQEERTYLTKRPYK